MFRVILVRSNRVLRGTMLNYQGILRYFYLKYESGRRNIYIFIIIRLFSSVEKSRGETPCTKRHGCNSRLCTATIKHDSLIPDIRSVSDARVRAGRADRHVRKHTGECDGRLVKLLYGNVLAISRRGRHVERRNGRLRWFLLEESASCGWETHSAAASEHASLGRRAARACVCVHERLMRREGTPAPEARAARNTQRGARPELREQHAATLGSSSLFEIKPAEWTVSPAFPPAWLSPRRSSISYTRCRADSMEFCEILSTYHF